MQVVNDKFYETAPSWSPDGKEIVYHGGYLYIVNLESGISRQVGDQQWGFVELDWSPASNQIVFSASATGSITNSQIYVINTDGSGFRQLTSPPTQYSHPRWSPDGTRITFASNHDVYGESGADIYIMNADGSNVTRLTDHPAVDFTPAWSPDGTRIAFLSNRDGRTYRPPAGSVELNLFHVYIMNADGSNIRQITFNRFGSHQDIDWTSQ
jgi:TolB protein